MENAMPDVSYSQMIKDCLGNKEHLSTDEIEFIGSLPNPDTFGLLSLKQVKTLVRIWEKVKTA